MTDLEYQRDKLEQTALAYARMETLGRYVENGNDCIVSYSDRKDYTETCKRNLLYEAINLFSLLSKQPLPPREKTK